MAFRAPKHEPDTKMARMREPIGPKTFAPNAMATVLLDLITERGSTRK